MSEVYGALIRAARGELASQRKLRDHWVALADVHSHSPLAMQSAEWWSRICEANGDQSDREVLCTILSFQAGLCVADDDHVTASKFAGEALAHVNDMADRGSERMGAMLLALSAELGQLTDLGPCFLEAKAMADVAALSPCESD